jgi:hypothetical protein
MSGAYYLSEEKYGGGITKQASPKGMPVYFSSIRDLSILS